MERPADCRWPHGGSHAPRRTPAAKSAAPQPDASDKIGWMLAAFGVLSFVCTLALSETRNRAMESDQAGDIAGATVRS